jgi:type II secretory pathway pseudopilin PulG
MCRMIGALVAVMWVAGASAVKAQDAASMAMQAAQQANDMAMQAAQQAMQMAQQAAMDNSYYAPPRPPLPTTPRPMISPGGGRFKGNVKVAIQDADPRAIVFYTTDGSVPTPRSQRYVAPIVVNASSMAKRTVKAMAFDLEAMPSGVVSKTFKVTS